MRYRIEKDALGEKIDETEDERFAILAKKRVLDEQIELTKAEIANIEEQIALYEQLIEEKELEVQEAQRREDEQFALYKERVRKMEEAGSISYLSVIFEATIPMIPCCQSLFSRTMTGFLSRSARSSIILYACSAILFSSICRCLFIEQSS